MNYRFRVEENVTFADRVIEVNALFGDFTNRLKTEAAAGVGKIGSFPPHVAVKLRFPAGRTIWKVAEDLAPVLFNFFPVRHFTVPVVPTETRRFTTTTKDCAATACASRW